jgi:inner membrane protein
MPFDLTLSKITESGLAWFILGVVLLLIELSAPGFLAIFFAAGAWITAILLWLGIVHGAWVPLAVFLVTSVMSLVLLRRRLKAVVGSRVRADANTDVVLDEFVGKVCMVVEPIDPQRHSGKVEFRGTTWNARSDQSIVSGVPVKIVSRDNLILIVKQIEE